MTKEEKKQQAEEFKAQLNAVFDQSDKDLKEVSKSLNPPLLILFMLAALTFFTSDYFIGKNWEKEANTEFSLGNHAAGCWNIKQARKSYYQSENNDAYVRVNKIYNEKCI